MAFARLYRRVSATGNSFPAWVVPSRTGHHVALISERPADPHTPWGIALVVRTETLTPMVQAGLVWLGEPELVPEFEGRRAFRWEPGAAGCRLVWGGWPA